MKLLWSSLLASVIVSTVDGSDIKMKKGKMMMGMVGAKKKGGGLDGEKNHSGGLRASRKKIVPKFMQIKTPDQTFVQEQDIIDGTYLLYALEIDREIYATGGEDYKGHVNGLFCKIDLSSQKDDPSKVPFYMNFVRDARCNQEGNHVKLDLYDIVQKTRAHDVKHQSEPTAPKSIPPTAFLYHEGRCGSTLVSNSVTALAPEKTRTYSEPLPVLQALLDCDKTRVNCNVDKAANLFRDVVYMMGRTSRTKEERMFFKLLPGSILGVEAVKQAFPNVPWAFIYRDPVHVMVSNLRDKKSDNAPGPYCMGFKKQKHQSEYLQDLVLSAGKTVEELTHEEYCAAYLASLTTAASEEIAFTEGGIAINYAEMPDVLIDTVFPKHFGLPVGAIEKERVLEQFGVYSKRMKRENPKEAKDDSAEKEEEASAEIRHAVNLFLSDSYQRLLQLNKENFVPDFKRKLTMKSTDGGEQNLSSAVVIYDPLVSKTTRGLQTIPAFTTYGQRCDFTGQQFCCPMGTLAAVRSATTTSTYTYTSSLFSTPGATVPTYIYYSVFFTCSIVYDPPCMTDCIYKPDGFTGPCEGTGTFGLGTGVYPTTFTEEFADDFCPAPTTPPTSEPTGTPTSSPTREPSQDTFEPTETSPPTSSPTGAPTSSPTSNPTSAPTSSPTSAPTSSPTSNPTSMPTSAPTSAPTSSPTSTPTSTPTAVPTTATPTSVPTTAAPTTSAAPTSTLPEDLIDPFCSLTTPVCPSTGKSNRNGMDEPMVPICVAKEKRKKIEYETKCVMPSQLEAMTSEEDEDSSSNKGRKKGREKKKKSSKIDIENYTCGCCDPKVEGKSFPDFCIVPICAENPTPCEMRRRLKTRKNGDRNGNRIRTPKNNEKKRRKRKKKNATPGVTICVDGVTMCVDQMDLNFMGASYTCGACMA